MFGGWLSGAFMKRGWSVNAGRKTTMLIAALLIVPTMFAPSANNMWVAVLIVGIAAAAHQWWSANIFTLSSDMFPRYAVGSVVGIGGFFGAAGGALFQRATGWLLQHNGSNYTPIFVVCGWRTSTALLVIHLSRSDGWSGVPHTRRDDVMNRDAPRVRIGPARVRRGRGAGDACRARLDVPQRDQRWISRGGDVRRDGLGARARNPRAHQAADVSRSRLSTSRATARR